MNRAVEGLYRSLEPLRLYALRQGSLIDKELMSYGEGFGGVESLADEILAEAFVETAGGALFARHERLAGAVPRAGLPDEARRALLLGRLAAPEGGAAPFTPEGMRGAILALGVDAELTEHAPEEAITVSVKGVTDKSLDPARLTSLILAVLPAHLDCVLDYGGVSWDRAEERFETWDAWDAAGLSWDAADMAL